MIEDNPFERDTEILKNKDALIDLTNVRRIMLDSERKKFQ